MGNPLNKTLQELNSDLEFWTKSLRNWRDAYKNACAGISIGGSPREFRFAMEGSANCLAMAVRDAEHLLRLEPRPLRNPATGRFM